jgi:hypothetical protein
MAAKGKALSPEVLQLAFLSAYEGCGIVSRAARAAGISKSTHYEWLSSDEAYAAAFKEAEKTATDSLLDEARRRAVQGVEKPVLYKGSRCYEMIPHPDPKKKGVLVEDHTRPIVFREYSDSMLMFLIKQRDPSFREHSKVELGGAGGGPARIEVVFVKPE